MISLDGGWIQGVALACIRITAFLVVAPPFSHQSIPIRIKAMLGVGIAIAVVPTVQHDFAMEDVGVFLLSLVAEALTGLALGFLVMLVFSAVQAAGGLIDLFGGFQIASGYDPGMNINGAQFTRILQMTALALLFASDGYQLVLGGVIRSFQAIPLGGRFDMAHFSDTLVVSTSQMFLSAVQIAGPLVVVLVLADVGLGLLTRVAPALNAFSLGFPLKIFITIGVAAIALVSLPQIVQALSGRAVDVLGGLAVMR
jgi:flagellar biosynthesis protein FliR